MTSMRVAVICTTGTRKGDDFVQHALHLGLMLWLPPVTPRWLAVQLPPITASPVTFILVASVETVPRHLALTPLPIELPLGVALSTCRLISFGFAPFAVAPLTVTPLASLLVAPLLPLLVSLAALVVHIAPLAFASSFVSPEAVALQIHAVTSLRIEPTPALAARISLAHSVSHIPLGVAQPLSSKLTLTAARTAALTAGLKPANALALRITLAAHIALGLTLTLGRTLTTTLALGLVTATLAAALALSLALTAPFAFSLTLETPLTLNLAFTTSFALGLTLTLHFVLAPPFARGLTLADRPKLVFSRALLFSLATSVSHIRSLGLSLPAMFLLIAVILDWATTTSATAAFLPFRKVGKGASIPPRIDESRSLHRNVAFCGTPSRVRRDCTLWR
mmetsp:Transcript_60014/g.137578  ORF Transcript_60014/g.137578 Transcript_60014/m.137578 type:complete len:394 (+) Transcript_60014:1015-2196(+)